MAKVVFIQDIAYEYFGVMYLSAFIKEHGHECDVLIESLEPDLMEALEGSDADLFAFSTLTGSFKWGLNMAAKVKERFDTPVIFGGVHIYSNPEKAIKFDPIDIICTGEGELPLKLLCDSIDAGGIDTTIAGMYFKKDGEIIRNKPARLVDDLDELPFPDRTVYWKYESIESRDTLPILGSRGCPYNCSYCFIPTAKEIFKDQGLFVRQRSPELVWEEIQRAIDTSPRKKVVHFVEDHFGNNRTRTLKLLQGLSTLQNGTLKWMGAIRIERFMEEWYVEELSKTNHGLLGLAVECGNEQFRNEVLHRETTNDDIIRAATLANKYGIKFTTLNMIGLPGETYEQALETLELNLKLKPLFANCYIYQPYPGTKLQEYAVQHNYITESISDNLGFSFYDRYKEDDKDFQKLINLQRVFCIIVAFPFLKKPLLKLASFNNKFIMDALFGVYYLNYLHKYYNLTLLQIKQYIVLWYRNKFSSKQNPVNISISKGKGQFYSSKA